MNNWIGIGRATKDVEKHTTANGSAVARFSIAVDRKQKNADGERITDFISVVAFGKIAEIAEQYIKKGDRVAINGELHITSWEDDLGNKKIGCEILANELVLLGGKNKE